jgi:hypothetical protein
MMSLADGVDPAAARSFAVEYGIVGAGWALSDAPDPSPLPDRSGDLDQYLQLVKGVFPKDNSVAGVATVFGKQMQIGDYCWMYVTHTGEYWCCRIDGDFEYRTGGSFDEHDLHLTRRCTWAKAGPADAVPGVVRRAFAGPFGTVSAMVTDSQTAIDAAEIHLNQRAIVPGGDLFAVAGPEDLEDIVSLYLQEAGWRVFPSTAKVSMASYEFVLVHSQTGQYAGVQVKSGNVAFLNQEVAQAFDVFFVFMANPSAIVADTDPRIARIKRDEILAFARRAWKLLPRRLQVRWPIVSQSLA